MTRILLRRGNHDLLSCVLQLRSLILICLSYGNYHLPHAGHAQDLVGIGSWADHTTECLEIVREIDDILSGKLELN